ncbi:MAG: fasciclin domain-containing protein, partial [Planctomycetota bacterium]
PGPFTIFAPTDEAFGRLPAGAVAELLKPENKAELAGLLKYHVIAGRLPLARALEAGKAVTLQGGELAVTFTAGRVVVGDAALLKADITAANGVVHVVDSVLMPPAGVDAATQPTTLIKLAISRGVPQFNNGNPRACVAIYEVASQALCGMPTVPEDCRTALTAALDEIQLAKTDRERAWVLRRALDGVLATLASPNS